MTELIWDGKYDATGKKNAPVRIALPFQTVETVNESTADRSRTLDLFAQGKATAWRNRLIWGDKKYVLPSLLPEFAGQVNLIYIDPPFFTGTDQIYAVPIADSSEFLLKQPSIIEEAAYRNVWKSGSDSFCSWMYDTLIFLNDLLSENGGIFIRFDQYWSHYVKIISDEIFGKSNFRNEIVLKRIYKNLTNQGRRSLQLATDSLFLYFKSEKGNFYEIETFLENTRPGYWRRIDDSSGIRKPPERIIFGQTYYPPHGKHFKFGQKKIDDMCLKNKIRINANGRPEYWVEPSDKKPLTSNWTDISSYSFGTGYPTENSEIVLERVINLCSKQNDLVLDCFCGSGTTPTTAEKLNRRWIACDLGRFAIHTTRKRLLGIPGVKPFVVQNLGKYERQQWLGAEFQSVADQASLEEQYRHFILQLYHASAVSGHTWLHGARNGRLVHVSSVDAPVTINDVKSLVQEFWKIVGQESQLTTNGIDVLGWDFAFELNEVAAQFAAANKVDLKFKKIPREVLEKRAVEQGDIKFFELASLAVAVKVEKRTVQIQLTDFILPPDDVPAEVRSAITHWSQWIDYWAVDWNFREDTFHNEWQSYRTRKDPRLELQARGEYTKPGRYQMVIKVIDILGNDTTKMLTTEVF